MFLDECYRGKCENEKCICDQGWTGDSCDKCEGRVLLTENEGMHYGFVCTRDVLRARNIC